MNKTVSSYLTLTDVRRKHLCYTPHPDGLHGFPMLSVLRSDIATTILLHGHIFAVYVFLKISIKKIGAFSFDSNISEVKKNKQKLTKKWTHLLGKLAGKDISSDVCQVTSHSELL